MGNKLLKYVDIVFENCDFCQIPMNTDADNIRFYIEGIKDSAFNINDGKEVWFMKIAESLEINIPQKTLNFPTHWKTQDIGFGNTLSVQLGFRDITGIRLVFKDESVEYSVVYEEEDEDILGSPNKNQVNEFLDNGSCRVIIKGKR